MKAPRSKLQHPKKLQAPNTNGVRGRVAGLELDVWYLSGAWSLVFGVSL
jgi:hypothetical protein